MAADSKFRLKPSVVGWGFQNHGAKGDMEHLCAKAEPPWCVAGRIVGVARSYPTT